ncbi:MAG: ATP-binding protein [Actinomycetota bacterium]|nr:ATP-binding protein [Actinomycetota bacterium]MDP2287173.1 ATP-binding protein [Actinomycetota bacterium]
MRFVHELEHEPSALRPARNALEAWCVAQGVDPESIVIMANELCTNAIRDGKGPVTLSGSCSTQWLSISVQQRGSVSLAMPPRAWALELRIAGRGLRMVDSLAQSWGWQTTADQTLVWARIARVSS